jgi:hypothetical protein
LLQVTKLYTAFDVRDGEAEATAAFCKLALSNSRGHENLGTVL